jgi:hypothetical protein
MTIADRAAAAHDLMQRFAVHPVLPHGYAADVARTAARLAALLGIDPANVRIDDWDDLMRPPEPLILHADDPDVPGRTYAFCYRDPLYDDEPFYLLGPCPACGATVPLREIVRLADLGAFLADGPAPMDDGLFLTGYPDGYLDDFPASPAHLSICPAREAGD